MPPKDMPPKTRKTRETPDDNAAGTGRTVKKNHARRRMWFVVLAALFIVAAALTAWVTLRTPAEAKQNVMLIIIDTVRRDALGCYGNPLNPSPNIDAVAADGVRFEQAISASGWTLPSVASLLTGTWPTIHGGSGKISKLTAIRDEVPTAAEVMKSAGFQTFAFANAAFVSPMLHLDRGFEVFDHKYTYNDNYRRADETIDAVIPLLDQNRSKANFIMIHLFDPHLDYGAPVPYRFK
ncbi:MAG: sulfatase-like hydrolase/transferase, partial [Candidatus Latescibacterota bacterium]